MKRFIIPLLCILAFAGCGTIQPLADTAQTAVVEVQDEHTPQEWAAFYDVLGTLTAKAQEIALTRTGAKVFGQLHELAVTRSEQWKAKIEPVRVE